jgi:hypothetical protein
MIKQYDYTTSLAANHFTASWPHGAARFFVGVWSEISKENGAERFAVQNTSHSVQAYRQLINISHYPCELVSKHSYP